MTNEKRKRTALTVFIVMLNIALLIGVICSVLFAFSDAEESSFTQNIENVRTLTDASANKVEIEITNYTKEVKTAASYINNYNNGEGMTIDEIRQFFAEVYATQDFYAWQLVDNFLDGNANPSNEGFDGFSLTQSSANSFVYRAKAYPELARIFGIASEETLGVVNYTSEFTDPSDALEKSFAVTTTIKIRTSSGYDYKTLMRIVLSDHINAVISSNNDIDTLSYFDYSNIIVDDSGNYVISNSYFQGTNFVDYIKLYNDDFLETDSQDLLMQMKNENYSDSFFYNNNKSQKCVYTVVPIQNSNWHVLSIVPIDSFQEKDNFSTNYFRFFITFFAMFALDMTLALLLNRKLRRKKKEAEAANVAKSQFLSSMSHDIRTPMNAIIGMTVIANENLEEETLDRDTLKDCVKTIELSGNHLLTLINDILDISKIESGKVVLSPDDFSISETMSKMLEIVQPQITEKKFTFETHIVNVNHEFVHADELRLNQVFINILSNAIKYTNPGGKITVDLTEEEIPGRTDIAKFIYKVSDTGIGMDSEFQKTIFERFTRAVDTRINVVQGSGLGMSIVKQLIDLMDGEITVESKLNVGSTFTVTVNLPVADIRAENVSLNGMSALLIDDDIILLETAKMSLEKAGMTVDTVSTGSEGIKLAQKKHQSGNNYSVIMVDWKMSEMNGIEVVKELKAKLGNDIKIVVMTAYNIADIEHEARAAGVDGFITKPLFKSKLLHTVQSLFTDEPNGVKSKERQTFNLDLLVAEDNHVNWKVLERLLVRYGINPERAENGKIALQMIENRDKPYDLVLMDIQMPVMNGYDATEAIRALDDKAKAQTPIYAMTADTFAEDVSKCMEKGMNGHLAKPIEIDKLLKVLVQLSDNKEKTQ